MRKLLALLLTLSLATMLLSGCGGETKKGESNQTKTEQKHSEDDVYFEDNTLNIRDLKIKILETKILPPHTLKDEYSSNEKPVALIVYEFTNKRDEPTSPMIGEMVCFSVKQETEKTLEDLNPAMTIADPNYKGLFETAQVEVKKGATVKAAAIYELKYPDKPVKVIVSQGIGNKIGEFEIK